MYPGLKQSERNMSFYRKASVPVVTLFLLLAISFAPPKLFAQDAPDAEKRALEQRVEKLEKALAAVQAQLAAMQGVAAAQPAAAAPVAPSQAAQAPPAPVNAQAMPQTAPATAPTTAGPQVAQQHPAPATVPGSTTPSSSGVFPEAVALQTLGENQPTTAEMHQHKFFERKPGRDLTFYTRDGEITPYGNLDLSFDVFSKGIGNLLDGNGAGPVGNMGWMPDISTNLSYIGIRGFQSTGIKNLNFIYQLETQIDISSTSGSSETNSTQDNAVKGGLTSRNSFIGLGSASWGAVLFGKTDAPYKLSTTRMNPFVAMIGDYAAIMGDTRVEFGTRLDHSIWYTSKKLNGFEADVLFAPGQNRSNINNNIAAGEVDCTGNDNPGDGGDTPLGCNDGGFGNAVSASLTYTKEPLYIVVAYERHMKVNRQSDLTGLYANVPTAYFNADVADEDAGKIGVQYTFPSKTTVSAIYENMHRYVPYFLEFQNERQRQGSWLAATQSIGKFDSLSAGWARAYRAVGDPGQHNTSNALPPLGQPGDATGGRGMDNSANLFTMAYRHRLGEGLTAYAAWASTFNGEYGHFDLGAGGRGVTADCHDASDAVGGESSDPHCWAGGHLKAISIGLDKRF